MIKFVACFITTFLIATPSYAMNFQHLCHELVLLSIVCPGMAEVHDLKKLNLSNKGIEKLHKYLKRTVKFRTSLSGSKDIFERYLKETPKKLHPKIERFDLSYNQLTVLPKKIAELTNLTDLNVSHNKLRKLPFCIGQLKKLKKLNISHNENLKCLPNTITQLSNLQTLELGHPIQEKDILYCELQALPEDIELMPQLDTTSKQNLLILKKKFARQHIYQQIKNSPIFLETFKKELNEEQKDAIGATDYALAPIKGREALKTLAHKVFESLAPEAKINLDATEFANYIIQIRENVLDGKPINVIDSASAFARAAQRLSYQEKEMLTRKNYIAHKDDALKAISVLSHYAMEELKNKNLLPPGISDEDFIQQSIKSKAAELDKVYL